MGRFIELPENYDEVYSTEDLGDVLTSIEPALWMNGAKSSRGNVLNEENFAELYHA